MAKCQHACACERRGIERGEERVSLCVCVCVCVCVMASVCERILLSVSVS